MKETEIGQPVVAYLEAQGWDVYQEVRPAYGDPVADVVGVMEHGRLKTVWVVECKTSLGLALLDQALGWIGYAHYVSIAVPRIKRANHHRSAEVLMKDHGIGWLEVGNEVSELIAPKMNHKPHAKRLLNALVPEQKHTCMAGTKGGGYYTSFGHTCKELALAAHERPGISLKEAIEHVKELHYRSTQTARTCLARALDRGWVKGVEGRREGKQWTLYPSRAM